MKVMCIDDNDTKVVLKGEIYEVVNEWDIFYDIIVDDKRRNGMFKERFIILQDKTILDIEKANWEYGLED